MPSKYQEYRQMADTAERQLTSSYKSWTQFLRTAARLYKYPYNEQVMIHAQRPDATACAEYDFWNKKMGRFVRRGSTGIALIDTSGQKPQLRYVFDMADTGEREHSRPMHLWQFRAEHEDAVAAALERSYGVSGKDGIVEQMESAAAKLAREYWADYKRDILHNIDDSYLDGYDEFNTEVQFRNAAKVSITYMLMSRCGLEPEAYLEPEDFMPVFDFNTPAAVAALGTAVSEISQQVLRQIEVAIRNYAEIKALCAGDERIKEKMDLDVDVARLKLMRANHQSQQYKLEDSILKRFPEEIEKSKGFISGLEADMRTLAAHSHPEDGFAGMTVKNDNLTDKDNAGAALLEAFKDVRGMEPVPIGTYRGFQMSLTLEDFGKDYVLTLKGQMTHCVTLGKDARGNLTRIDNVLNAMPDRLQNVRNTLEATTAQMEAAKAELGKPFPQEEELRVKSARLAELNAELNIDERTPVEQLADDAAISAKAERPSVLARLKNTPTRQTQDTPEKQREQESR